MFFFKQKTAYEMRISDWSSDVCSSDLIQSLRDRFGITILLVEQMVTLTLEISDRAYVIERGKIVLSGQAQELLHSPAVKESYQIGRASCRERVCQYV